MPQFIGTTRLQKVLGLNWYGWRKYRDVIGEPDAEFDGQPAWMLSRVPEIDRAISAYCRRIEETKANL
jgi:hypothetical protein